MLPADKEPASRLPFPPRRGAGSGYRGVFRTGSTSSARWQVRVSWRGQKHYVGIVNDKREGARAHDKKIVELGCVDPDLLNFPGDLPTICSYLERDADVDELQVERGAVRGQDRCFTIESTSAPVDYTVPRLADHEGFRRHGFVPKISSSTGFRGVHVQRTGKDNTQTYFHVQVWKDTTCWTCSMGENTTAEEAARVYDAKARKIGKGVEYLNFPDDPSLDNSSQDVRWVSRNRYSGARRSGKGSKRRHKSASSSAKKTKPIHTEGEGLPEGLPAGTRVQGFFPTQDSTTGNDLGGAWYGGTTTYPCPEGYVVTYDDGETLPSLRQFMRLE